VDRIARLHLNKSMPMWVAYPLLLVICVTGSVIFYLVCMRFVVGSTEVIGVLVSLAVGFALEGVAAVEYGPDPHLMPRVIPFKSFP